MFIKYMETRIDYYVHWVIFILFYAFFLYSCIENKIPAIHALSIVLCLFVMFRWATDYRLCTISYIEMLARNVKKEDSLVYRFLDDLVNLNTCSFKYFIYVSFIVIMSRNIHILYNKRGKILK